MKKTGLLILVVVLVLGAIGVGYAAWSQTLTINGKVSTGTYDVQFQTLSASETDALGVGNVTADNLAVDKHSFDVTITNGYPGYIGVAHFEVKNAGSVPAKVTSITLTPVGGDASPDFSFVVNGIAVDAVIVAGGTQTPCDVTITILGDATEGVVNSAFTVEIATSQGTT